MNIKERIMADVKDAMRNKESDRLTTLRGLHSAIKNREIEVRPNEIDEQEVMAVLKKLIKQRQEANEQYEKANRPELAAKEQNEIKIIENYLPQQLSRAQIEQIVADVIKATGASSIKQMGQVMKEVQAKTAGAADNKIVSEVVKAKLS